MKVLAPETGLVVWTIYEHPSDYPESYILRRSVVSPGGQIVNDPEPTAVVYTILQCRMAVPPGLVCMPRQDDDDPVIVETWI